MASEPVDRFEEHFKEWASGPPATPADEAARQVLRRLPTESASRPVLSWFRIAAVAAAVLAMVLATRFYLQEPISPVAGDTTVGVVEAPPVPDGVALILLESGTPLYLTLNAPVMSQGDPQS